MQTRTVVLTGFVALSYALTCAAAPATTQSHTTSTSHAAVKPTQPSYIFCRTTGTPQYYSKIFQSTTWNHATDFQAFVAKQYNRGNQAATCYPRATNELAEKYKEQLIASVRAKVPEDAPKREVVVQTTWVPPPPKPAAPKPPSPAPAPSPAAQ